MNKIVLCYRQTGPVEWIRNMKAGLATAFSLEITRHDADESLISQFKGRMVVRDEGWEIRNLKDQRLIFDENDPLFMDLKFDECLMVLESFIGEVVGTAEEILNGVNQSDNRVVVTLRDEDSGMMWHTDWELCSRVQPLQKAIRRAHGFLEDYLEFYRLGYTDLPPALSIERVRELYQELDQVVADMVLELRG
jgi:hypothetical protein